MAEKNYYDILGIKFNATKKEIRHAYKNKVKEQHPDQNTGNTSIIEVIAAYKCLSDIQQRGNYDKTVMCIRYDLHVQLDVSLGTIVHGGIVQTNVAYVVDPNHTSSRKFSSTDINVTIPPMSKLGDTIIIYDHGIDVIAGIHVIIDMIKDENIMVNGFDLISFNSTSIIDLLLQNENHIITPTGEGITFVYTNKGNGKYIHKIANMGLPITNEGLRGNLFIRPNITVPEITDAQRDVLRDLF